MCDFRKVTGAKFLIKQQSALTVIIPADSETECPVYTTEFYVGISAFNTCLLQNNAKQTWKKKKGKKEVHIDFSRLTNSQLFVRLLVKCAVFILTL